MFRPPVSMSFRLLTSGLTSSVSRFRLCCRADDMTKIATGCHHVQWKYYWQSQPYGAVPVKHCTHSCLHRHIPCVMSRNSVDSFDLQPSFPGQCGAVTMNYSTSAGDGQSKKNVEDSSSQAAADEVKEEKESVFQRFKRAYKEHGKILMGVHIVTSIVWYGSFYAAARCGLDIVPWMEAWGFNETIIKPFRAGGLGDFALAYLMYKLATPVRYTVTLGGTNLVIKHFRRTGKMAPKSQEDSLRELYKEGRQKLKDSNVPQDQLKKLREVRERRKVEKRKEPK